MARSEAIDLRNVCGSRKIVSNRALLNQWQVCGLFTVFDFDDCPANDTRHAINHCLNCTLDSISSLEELRLSLLEESVQQALHSELYQLEAHCSF